MGRKLRIQLGENKEDKYGNRWKAKTICVHKSTQREERPEREREREREKQKEKQGHKLKGEGEGTSRREQGGQARRQTFPKPPERRTQSHGKRSEGMGDREVPVTESTQRKNRNGDREVWREVGNRQGDM